MIKLKQKDTNEEFVILYNTEMYYSLVSKNNELKIISCAENIKDTINFLSLKRNENAFIIIDSVHPEFRKGEEVKYENKVYLNEKSYSSEELKSILFNTEEKKKNDLKTCNNNILAYKIKNASDLYPNKRENFDRKKEFILDMLDGNSSYFRLLLEHIKVEGVDKLLNNLSKKEQNFFISTIKNLNDLSDANIYDLMKNSNEPTFLSPYFDMEIEKDIKDGKNIYLHENVGTKKDVKYKTYVIGRLNKHSNKLRSLIINFYKKDDLYHYDIYKPDVKKAP